MLSLYYHPLYTYGIDKKSRFPRDRYKLIFKKLRESKADLKFHTPEFIKKKDIALAHDPRYINLFLSGKLSIEEKRRIGLQPWNNNIVDRTKLILGGSIGALSRAIENNGIAANMAGGTHHAHYSFGSGYCIFNDLAICARKAIKDYDNINKIMIIDLDVHQGDGTAAILSKDKDIFTLSVHCESNFPMQKMKSSLDINLKKQIDDREYLSILSKILDEISTIDSDILFFQAGVDTLYSDKLGHLSLTRDGLKIRNKMVLDYAKSKAMPVVVFMGGGYSDPIDDTVDAFVDLFEQCSDYVIS